MLRARGHACYSLLGKRRKMIPRFPGLVKPFSTKASPAACRGGKSQKVSAFLTELRVKSPWAVMAQR